MPEIQSLNSKRYVKSSETQRRKIEQARKRYKRYHHGFIRRISHSEFMRRFIVVGPLLGGGNGELG